MVEEALAEVDIGSLLAVIDVPHADQVHVFFRAQLPRAVFGVGREPRGRALEESTAALGRHRVPERRLRVEVYVEDAAPAETRDVTTIDLRLPRAG